MCLQAACELSEGAGAAGGRWQRRDEVKCSSHMRTARGKTRAAAPTMSLSKCECGQGAQVTASTKVTAEILSLCLCAPRR